MIARSIRSPREGKAAPRKYPSSVIERTQSTAPTRLQKKKRRRSIRVTPATTVTKVRTNGTNRPITSALLPCRSKKARVWSKYFCFMTRPSRWYSGGPIARPIS